ncbi:MAG TPA: hypothetical protein DER64_20305 [Planctomycetaceae bacterium]|nr:hypothetical protein [Planctomycetaceae bacterium]
MKRSIAFRGQSGRLTLGRAGRTGGMNDQWGCQRAPWTIHFSINRVCRWVIDRPESDGGILSSASLELIRW